VPVALLDTEIWNARDAAGEWFRSMDRQMSINQGIYVASPEGKALATIMPGRAKDGKPVDPEEAEEALEKAPGGWLAGWTRQVLAAIERGLRAFGEVKPREGVTPERLPSDASGLWGDGSASLVAYIRSMDFRGLDPAALGGPAIESVTLPAKEFATLAPPEPVAGSRWTVPERVARTFNFVLGAG
jgi:hypothetical protein